MAFVRSSRPRSAHPRSPRLVLAVGQRAFVHAPDGTSRLVSLTNGDGIPGATVLTDGAEVEVLAWRPRGSTGTRYRIRHRSDGGADGWVAAEELRTTAVRATPELEPVSEPHAGFGRPFGSTP
jgi:hypothetical protein